MSLKNMIWTTVLLSALCGCGAGHEKPAQFHTLADAGWTYGDTLFFNNIADTVYRPYDNVELVIRHTEAYSYSNLWVEMSYTSDSTQVADTFNIVLADSYGKWYGKGPGPVISLTDTLRLSHIPDSASVPGLRHIMRMNRVDDIEQIGMRILTPDNTPQL